MIFGLKNTLDNNLVDIFRLLASELSGEKIMDVVFGVWVMISLPIIMDILTLKVTRKASLTHNTFILDLQPVDSSTEIPPFQVSSFVLLYDDTKANSKPYTPIFATQNLLRFAIKTYKNGCISTFLDKKQSGDIVCCSLPIEKLRFDESLKDILMIAGGTGITPMLQILEHCLKIHERGVKVPNFVLFNCNLTSDDIFLEDLIQKYANFTKTIHIVEKITKKSPNRSNIVEGRINKQILSSEVICEDDLLVDFCYICGPPSMMQAVCGSKNIDKSQGDLSGILKDLGFTKEMVYKF